MLSPLQYISRCFHNKKIFVENYYPNKITKSSILVIFLSKGIEPTDIVLAILLLKPNRNNIFRFTSFTSWLTYKSGVSALPSGTPQTKQKGHFTLLRFTLTCLICKNRSLDHEPYWIFTHNLSPSTQWAIFEVLI